MIYLDYAATTPMSERSLETFTEVARHYFGNPSSLHDAGSSASTILNKCRRKLAEIVNGSEQGIYFTSGGSESNILALQSLIDANKQKGNHLITTVIEHSSVLNLFAKLERQGYEVTYLPTNNEGQIELDTLKKAVRPNTILASIHCVNGELGTIQQIDQFGEFLHSRGILLHCDSVQAFGKLPIDIQKMKVDSISLSSHKIYGPKGVGAVYIDPSVHWIPQIPSTSHERGFRPGTINVPGIAAFITAAADMIDEMQTEKKRMGDLRENLINLLSDIPYQLIIEESATSQLPNILGLRIVGMEGQYAMLELNRHDIAVSTGSACQVGRQQPSKTMKAIGRTDEESLQFIRISMGKHTTNEDIQRTGEFLRSILDKYFDEQ
ncbi:IscS subfamily cysteine desulfurase [Sediminibacillus massiliensis]|uniref:IscS subfamily cysteine desulfurase n=1 Tax=Sediminibacillus massiliensis TaxID=1926277 RepID=UPI0009887004|nr:IscS subfamily cysteine desulfurase [Sediminibacillus massiliensis]